MRNRRPAPIGRRDLRICVTILAAFFTAAVWAGSHPEAWPAAEPAHYGIWKKRIKRLKPVDPESTETMFARADAVRAARHRAIV